jgi:predicted dehydrogenase
MARSKIDLDMNIDPVMPKKRDFGIGCIGSGFIMRDVQLVAYNDACFKPVAIASRTTAHAREAAEARAVPRVYDTWQELLDDDGVEVLDIAYPPDQ